MLGYQELIIIFLIVLLIFGGSKIPELARGLGKGINEFKKAKDGIKDEIEKEVTKESSDKKDQKKEKNDKDSNKIT
ncbi:MAG: twin-arginine translocase TatA/TatE family subunit [Victivallales bacterium]